MIRVMYKGEVETEIATKGLKDVIELAAKSGNLIMLDERRDG